jgi:hypothetical protein
MSNDLISIDGGSKQYWTELRKAWTLVHHLERCLEDVKSAPMYIRGKWDDEYGDYEPVENLGPWDDLAEAQKDVKANWMAMRIIEAHGREI